MKIGPFGIWEIVIILVIIAIIGGPSLFKKLSKRTKKTAKALKQGVESGAKNAGVDVEGIKAENAGKTVAEKIEAFQDKVDEKMNSREEIDFGAGDDKEA